MKIPNVTGLMKVGKTFIMANRPEILFGASVVGTLVAVGAAAKGGYEARGIVEKERADRAFEKMNNEWPQTYLEFSEKMDAEPKLTSKEQIQLTWLCYMPAMVSTVAAVGSTTGLHIVHVKEKKLLAQAALAAIEEVKISANEYAEDVKEAAKETLTPKKQEELDNAIEEKQIQRGLADPTHYVVVDAYTGRPFYSTENRIQQAVNAVNELLNKPSDVDLNYFYIQAGVPEIDRGDEYGWSGQNLQVYWTDSHLEDGRPARAFKFHPQPRKGYDTT